MAGTAGGAGLSGVSWIAVAVGVAAAAVGGAYVGGVFDPDSSRDVQTQLPAVAQAADPAGEPIAAVSEPDTSEGDEPQIADDAASDPATQPVEDKTVAETAETVAPAPQPSVDLIRVEPDGTTVIAGKAEAGSDVTLLLDGQTLEEQITADDSGNFVGFVTLPQSDQPRVLTLENASGEDSGEQIIIAPSPKADPVETAVASASTDPEATTSTAPATSAAAEAEQVEPAQTDTSEPNEQAAQVLVADPQTSAELQADAAPAQDATPAQDAEPSNASEPAPEQVAILRSNEEGVELIQPATPVAQTDLTLDTIGYSETGDVQLSGRAPAGSAIRVYLDNAATSDFAADAQGRWKGNLTEVVPGIYTLRLDAVDEAGKVLSRLETPFKREAPEVLRPKPTTAQPDTPITPEPAIRAVTVQKGDTLWAISRERYGDGVLYVKLFEANKLAIRDPNLIYPGQVFEIPQP